MHLRPFRSTDTDHLYDICLRTGDNGRDGSDRCVHPRLCGSCFAAPYAEHDPSLCLILEDDDGPCGYVLGTADTRAFAAWFNTVWLPRLRREFAGLKPRPDAFDNWMLDLIHEDMEVPGFVDAYPAHLHIDLLPRAQGGGWGRRMIHAWAALAGARGAPAFHLGVSSANANAVAFYRHIGLHEIARTEWGYFLGMETPKAGSDPSGPREDHGPPPTLD